MNENCIPARRRRDFFETRWSNTEFMNENDDPEANKRIQLVTSDASNHSFGPVELQSPKPMNIMKFISTDIIESPLFPSDFEIC